LAGTGAGTGLEKMAGYPANRNRNWISGTSLVFLADYTPHGAIGYWLPKDFLPF